MRLTPFAGRVLAVVRAIPRGAVLTYGQVADRAGQPGAARAVGTVLRQLGGGRAPCHRVIAANGRLGGFGGQEAMKRRLLLAEGVPMRGTRVLMGYPTPSPTPAARLAHEGAQARADAKGRYNRKR